MRRIIVLILIMATAAAMAQEKTPETAPAVAYFYIYHRDCQPGYMRSVFVDGVKTAKVHRGHWIHLDLAPGRHEFRADDKDNVVPAVLESGKKYYFRLSSQGGYFCTPMRIERVQNEQGEAEIVKLDREKS